MKDEIKKSLFLKILLDPAAWAEQADNLKAVADLIQPKVARYWQCTGEEREHSRHFCSSHLMISALALECCLKGILVAERVPSATVCAM
jgi:hypothetical protein